MKPDRRNPIVPSLCAALVIAAALWLVPSAFAKPGSPDPSFGNVGKIFTQNTNVKQSLWSSTGVQVAHGGNGMIYVLATYGGQAPNIIGFDSDGAVDKSFGSNGRLQLPGVGGSGFEVEAIAADASGRLIVAGQEASVTPGRPVVVYRFLSTGAPDKSFGASGSGYATATVPYSAEGVFGVPALPFVRGVAVAQTGQVVLSVAALYGGTFCGGPASSISVVRLTEGGLLDPTFGHDGIFLFGGQGQLADSTAPAVGPEGSIEVAGASSTCQTPGSSDPPIVDHLYRLSPAGQIDPTFGTGGVVEPTQPTTALAIDASGRTVALGLEGGLDRLTASGAPDPSFGDAGTVASPATEGATSLALTGGGSVLLVGGRTLTRLSAAGTVVRGFGNAGVVIPKFGKAGKALPKSILVDGEGHVLVGAQATSPSNPKIGAGVGLFRYNLGG